MEKCSIIKNRIMIVLLIVITVLINSQVAEAVNYTNIKTDNNWINGELLSAGNQVYYCIELKKAGWLTVDFQSLGIKAYCDVLSEDLTHNYRRCSIEYGYPSETNPVNSSIVLALEPGKYMIKISGGSWFTPGKYRIRANFEPVNNNEKNNNHSFGNAQALTFGQKIDGFISENEDEDFYSFTVEKNTILNIDYTSYIDSYTVLQLWNEDLMCVSEQEIYYGYESEPRKMAREYELNPGKYYIKITTTGYYQKKGRYSLKINEIINAKTVTISGKKEINQGAKVQFSASVLPINTSNKRVTWSSSNDYIAEVDSITGWVHAKCAGVVSIKAETIDRSDVVGTYTLIVLPARIPKPRAAKDLYSSKKANITWRSDGYVTGYNIQYGTSKKLKGAKIKTVKSGISTSLKKLKRKTYYVRVRSYLKYGSKKYYGKWSKVSKLKMR